MRIRERGNDGRLDALDTPAGLKTTWVPGVIFAVTGSDGVAVLREGLADVDDVVRLQPFGNGVHVRVHGDLREPATLKALLDERSLAHGKLEEVEATLEDVFLELVGGRRQ